MIRSLPLLAAGLVAVRAQLDSLPQCGQTCVGNMLDIAQSQFGCDQNNLAECACCNPDFGFGIRDCAQSVCGQGSSDYSSVVSYGSSYCASAITSCPSGTQATSVLASATGNGGAGSAGSASGTMSGAASTPAMTSGPLGGAVGAVSAVPGSSNAYVVNGQTITAGGDTYGDDDTTYSALPSGAGVVISNGDTATTYMPGSGAGGMSGSGSGSGSMATMTSGGNAGGNAGGVGALGAAGSSVSAVSGTMNAYVIDGQTITPGGSNYGTDGTTYSALGGGQGVLINGNGQSTIYNPSATNGGAGGGGGMSASASSSSSSNNGGSGGAAGGNNNGNNNNDNNNDNSNNSGSSSSSESGNKAPMQTAAPALIGAAAMAILAL